MVRLCAEYTKERKVLMGKIEIDILYCSQNNEHFTYAGQMKYLQTRDFKWMSTQ